MPAIEMVPKRNLTGFRKLSLGMWRTAYDPQIYGWRAIRMEQALAYIELFEARHHRRLTLTHLVTKAVGELLHGHPDLNAMLRFGRIYLRKHVDVAVNVAAPDRRTGGVDLLSATIRDVDRKSLLEVAAEIDEKVERVRGGGDPLQRGPGASMLHRMPAVLMRPLLNVLSMTHYGLNLDLSRFGFPRDPFGSALVTNVASLGVAEPSILGPLVPFTRMPLLILFGAVHEAPVVEGGEVKVGKVMNATFTVDHRFTDGANGVGAIHRFVEQIEDPFEHFDPV